MKLAKRTVLTLFTGILLWSPSAVLAETFNVTVDNFAFTPKDLVIQAGDTVTWTNVEGHHNVSADDESFRCANGCDGNGGNGAPSSNSWSFSLTFNEVGVIGYNCEPHVALGMVGSISVENTPGPDPEPGTIAMASEAVSVTESGGSVDVVLTRSNGSDGAVGVQYATASGTALAGQDYLAAFGNISWDDGDSSDKVVSIDIVDDTEAEDEESFRLELENPSGGALLSEADSTEIEILDDDSDPEPTSRFELIDVYTDGFGGGPAAFATALTHAGDGRLFLAIKEGTVRILENGELRPQPFLDLRGQVEIAGEQGLLGLAFHPEYSSNGYFFVDYVDLEGSVVVTRFTVSADPNLADPASGVTLLRIPQPFENHKGGALHFGPDDMLYVSVGDGGGPRDPFCSAQDDSSLRGKILRLDVTSDPLSEPHYRVPEDNPFFDEQGQRTLAWMKGLRNPWRFSFDRDTGDIYIGDVGANTVEEIDWTPFAESSGLNFGWKVKEGTLCRDSAGCSASVPACDSPEYTDPVIEYGRSEGCSVIGGSVYRGSLYPDLQGLYFYSDFCGGEIRTARAIGGRWQVESTGLSGGGVSFGEDVDGELYVVGPTIRRIASTRDTTKCLAGDQALCLNGGRFEVRTLWRTKDGGSGTGQAGTLTDDSGYFWFFSEENVEVVVKVLNACVPFEHFWVFAGGLTDVEVEVQVLDTVGGKLNRYSNTQKTEFQPLSDTTAFPTCP